MRKCNKNVQHSARTGQYFVDSCSQTMTIKFK